MGNTPILEYPNSLSTPDVKTFVRTLNIGPRDSELDMSVMELPSNATLEVEAGVAMIQHEDNVLLVAAPGFEQAAQFSLQDNRLVLTFTKGSDSLTGSVWFTDSTVDQDAMTDINTQLAGLDTGP